LEGNESVSAQAAKVDNRARYSRCGRRAWTAIIRMMRKRQPIDDLIDAYARMRRCGTVDKAAAAKLARTGSRDLTSLHAGAPQKRDRRSNRI
jgi:hypothetical protein